MKLAITFTNFHKQRIFLSLLIIGTFQGISICQSYKRLNIPLSVDNKVLKNPWVGGLIAPQFNSIDLDGDDMQDILVFDRLGDVLLPYLNVGNVGEVNYRFAPEFIDNFPPIEKWIKIRDYNGDGVPDLFTYPVGIGVPGVTVYKGKRENGELTFEVVESSLGQFDIIYFRIGGSVTQVYVSSIDLPEIADLDNDGDLDIIAFDPSGGQVSHYKNLAVEDGLSLDSLRFRLEDVCYGKFIESGFSEDVVLSSDGNRCGGSLIQNVVEVRHAGSTITAFDENGDDLVDIFLGDLTYNGIVRLTNGGTEEDAWFTESETGFPTYDESINIEVFNAIFNLDVDNDGIKDLVVAPNEDNAIQNSNHVWYYKNLGTNNEPDFELIKRTLFIEDMLHLGTDSKPVFTDVNQDGLLDIVVGTSGFRVNNALASRLYYLKNVGTYNVPEFIVEDDDYLGFSQFSETSSNLTPTFGDLDNDGDQDMIIGDDKGALYYLENNAGAGNPYSFGTPQYEYQEIRVGTHVKPFLVDINQDSLLDLVIGERNFNSIDGVIGSINYIENTGSKSEPVFGEVTSEVFGEVSTKDPGFINNYSSPYFYKNGEELLLFTGSENGRIFMYDNISSTNNAKFNLLEDDLGNIAEGIRTSPAIADINNDKVLDVLVGNRRGGLSIYTSDIINETVGLKDDLGDRIAIKVSPNPTTDFLEISIEKEDDFQYKLVALDGRILNQDRFKRNTTLNLRAYPQGIYFVEISNQKSSTTKKIIKI